MSIYTKEQVAEIQAIKRTCKGPLKVGIREKINELLVEGKMAEARAMDAANRLGCGNDFNETIIRSPEAGASFDVECPKCGVKTSFKSPKFEA